MPRLEFTPQLRRFTATPVIDAEAGAEAGELSALMQLAFEKNPALRAYVLDDQGQLRPHVAVFVDGRRCLDLSMPLQVDSQVHVLQALSGG